MKNGVKNLQAADYNGLCTVHSSFFFSSSKLLNPYNIGRYFLRDIWASGKIEAAQVEIVKKIKYTNVPGDGC